MAQQDVPGLKESVLGNVLIGPFRLRQVEHAVGDALNPRDAILPRFVHLFDVRSVSQEMKQFFKRLGYDVFAELNAAEIRVGLEIAGTMFEQRLFLNRFPRHCACRRFVQLSGKPRLDRALRFRQVVRLDRISSVAEVEAVGGDFEEEDFFLLPREFFVEKEDAGLNAGVRLEHACRE